ncbi:PAS domain-containing protein [Massilia glaciei]|uniref:PAS domain-containing protein n=1 Tax=Massilia glaciei TaxID=1524097 RepID=A0A2U2HE72_9BURK|nr:PAS domain-containing protein [Massilia glaciei]PWF41746.1 PAS domain-containing protein [Massilia glaciei]
MNATVSRDAPSDELIIEDDDPSDGAGTPAAEPPPWRILIVDDDVDVHVVTKFALSNTGFQGRRLSFLHAYSGKEALDVMRKTPDVALMLLDVIMETSDAGLLVAREVRETLHNELVRIVLRTGQPGQSFEHSIIVDYDINDFWCKADLTTRKLFTTVITSLRAYGTLLAGSAARDAILAELARARQVQAALDRHSLLLTLDAHGTIVEANDKLCAVFGIAREALVGRDLHALHPGPLPEPIAGEIARALRRTGGWAGDIHTAARDGTPIALRCAVLAFKDAHGQTTRHVAVGTPLDR